MKKRVAFLLPGISVKPAGGYKIVYEYANYLTTIGYDVDIVYPAYVFRYNATIAIKILRMFKAFLCFINDRRKYTPWFNLNAGIKEHFVWDLSEHQVPEADFYVATYVKTAVYLDKYTSIPSQNKFYFIQGYENWFDVTTEQLQATYQLNLRKIVVSGWLRDIVEKCNETCTFIPNGFDFHYFHKSIEISKKDRYCITMLYHDNEIKGCQDGFKALELVKDKVPQLHVNIFGAPKAPDHLPSWYTYYQLPDKATHNRIYNEASIFIGTSWSEGWGLTIGEAMICGCAIVCTDNLGYREMVTPNETALISPIKAPDLLAGNILKLIENDELRVRLAQAGYEHIQKFNWESSFKQFAQLLQP